jgi:hypothetical protein
MNVQVEWSSEYKEFIIAAETADDGFCMQQ